MQLFILLTQDSLQTTYSLPFNYIVDMIQIFVTIIGLIVTYLSLKRQFELSVLKEKTLNANKEMKEALNLSDEFYELYTDFLASLNKSSDIDDNKIGIAKRFNETRNKLRELIMEFGSLNTVKLWAHFDHNFVSKVEDNVNECKYWGLAVLLLIISQIKYDLYGIEMSPKYVLLMKFQKVYKDDKRDSFLQHIRDHNNVIVKELKLDDFLLISDFV